MKWFIVILLNKGVFYKMINKLNKVCYLVALASITSLVPVQGVFASDSVTRLESQDGQINEAVAYADSKYIYSGSKNDAETGVYVSSGSSDTKVSDNDILGKYDSKYVELDDSSNTLVDMSTLQVSSDEDIDTIDSEATIKAYSKLKSIGDLNLSGSSDVSTQRITGNTFRANTYTFTAKSLQGITDENGNYIAVNRTADLSVYDSTDNRLVKLNTFGEENGGYKATLNSYKVLAQTSDEYYIYSNVTATKISDGSTQSLNYIQVLSKTSTTDGDGYNVPSSVSSYIVTDNIFTGDAPNIDNITAAGVQFTVTGSSLLYYNLDGNNLDAGTVDLKKASVELTKDAYKIQTQYAAVEDIHTLSLNNTESVSVDTNGVLWGLSDNGIYKYVNGNFSEMYTCNGNLTHLDVYDSTDLIAWDDDGNYATANNSGTSSTDSTSTDSTSASTDSTSTGSTANQAQQASQTATANTTGTTATTTTGTTTGWVRDGASWKYYDQTGNMAVNKWIQSSGLWYYLGATGDMATGWVKDGANWYYLSADGSMKTGWIKDTDGSWYYLNTNGSMAHDIVVDGYKLGSSGAWVK